MKRLNYIDGLKGWCALAVCILHFQLMFAINGYVGWKCLPEAVLNPVEYYFRWFPYSIFSNNSFPLYIFFALISFVVCYLFLKNKDEEKLKQKIIMRYFRFLPLVLISCLVAYLLLAFGLCPLQEFYDFTGNTWGYARLEESYSFFETLKISFFTAFFKGTQLVSPFWCLQYIFLGSVMTYIMMLLYTRLNNKMFFFSFWALLFFFVDQNYLSFIVGMIAAIIANKEYALSQTSGAMLIFCGCFFGLFPPVLLPSFINIATFYAVGAGFILVGTHCCYNHHPVLCNRFMEFLGKESLSAIVWQFLIMQSLNIFLYNYFYKIGTDIILNVAINFVVNMGASLFLTWLSSKTITPLTNFTCSRVRALLWKHTL